VSEHKQILEEQQGRKDQIVDMLTGLGVLRKCSLHEELIHDTWAPGADATAAQKLVEEIQEVLSDYPDHCVSCEKNAAE
jgi:ABC-type Zn uptake system ZnuABC Zn-binding protein ZnuA